jgi:uncharacterized protein YuzE
MRLTSDNGVKVHYSYDPQADALYIYLRDDIPVSKTIQIDDQRNVDVDAHGDVVGIEVLSPGSYFPIDDLITRSGCRVLGISLSQLRPISSPRRGERRKSKGFSSELESNTGSPSTS